MGFERIDVTEEIEEQAPIVIDQDAADEIKEFDGLGVPEEDEFEVEWDDDFEDDEDGDYDLVDEIARHSFEDVIDEENF